MTTLKGGISNNVYVWHASDNACEKCQSLNGKEFDNIDDIPDRPHPNCKCYIEEKEDILCDCFQLYEKFENVIFDYEILLSELQYEINDIDNITKEADFVLEMMDDELDDLEPELGKHLPECEFNIDMNYGEIRAQKQELIMLIKDIISIRKPIQTLIMTVTTLVFNFRQLLDEHDGTMDKFYHSRANCENAQKGILSAVISEALCDLKELYDMKMHELTQKSNLTEDIKNSLDKKLKDNEADQRANKLGRDRGRQNPTCNCSTLMWDQRPAHRKNF